MATGKHLKAAILARRAAKGPRKKRTRPEPRQYTVADLERARDRVAAAELLSDYSEEQEADWYGAALLLPRSALVHHRSRGVTAADIADLYGVSGSLCEWRLRMTGVEIQVLRSRGR